MFRERNMFPIHVLKILHSFMLKIKVGDDFINAVQSFFASGRMLKESNATTFALIPKVPNPTAMSDFRPISCCNTIYKCISKILVALLKSTLPDIISRSQAAFVPGRNIGDNILLAQGSAAKLSQTHWPP